MPGTITLIQNIAAGNALRLFITPPPGALYWRVLRRTADVFTGPDDAGAVLVADLSDDNCILDTLALVNGVPVFYRAYCWLGTTWDSPVSVTATPAATYQGDGCDVVEILRARIDAGLQVEIARGVLLPVTGEVPVVLAPFMLAEKVRFPMVHIHLDSFAPSARALGEDMSGGSLDDDGWAFTEGFRARVSVNIAGISRLPDERNTLRRCLVRILQANFPVFAAAGIDLPEFSFGDTEQLEDKAASLFLTAGTFTCEVSSFVNDGQIPSITDTAVTLSPLGMEPAR